MIRGAPGLPAGTAAYVVNAADDNVTRIDLSTNAPSEIGVGDNPHGIAIADVITGDFGEDRLAGGKNDDRLYGGGGTDRLNGNRGSDRTVQ